MEFSRRITLFDGALGTELMRRGVDPKSDVNAKHVEVLLQIHKDYVDKGCDIITANTFLLNRIYSEFSGREGDVKASNVQGVKVAREAVSGTRTLVFGDIGPTGQFLEPYGDYTEEDFIRNYTEQAEALCEGGVDGFIIETMSDVNETACAVKGCKSVSNLPVIASFTLSLTPQGCRTMMGHAIKDIVRMAEELGVAAVGVNCVTLEVALAAVNEMVKMTAIPVLAQPNAGLPEIIDGKPIYKMGAGEFSAGIEECLTAGAKVVGGCCGTTPEHLKVVYHEAIKGRLQAT